MELAQSPTLLLAMPAVHRYGRAVFFAVFLLSCLSGVYVVFFCCFLRVAGKRNTLRVGLRSPIRRVSRTFFYVYSFFLCVYGGALRHPPILTKPVDIINTCLFFIFLKNLLTFLSFCVIILTSNKRGALYGKNQKPTN